MSAAIRSVPCQRVVVAQELPWIDHGAVLPDFEVHMGAGGAPGGAGPGDLLAAADQVADAAIQRRVVRERVT